MEEELKEMKRQIRQLGASNQLVRESLRRVEADTARREFGICAVTGDYDHDTTLMVYKEFEKNFDQILEWMGYTLRRDGACTHPEYPEFNIKDPDLKLDPIVFNFTYFYYVYCPKMKRRQRAETMRTNSKVKRLKRNIEALSEFLYDP